MTLTEEQMLAICRYQEGGGYILLCFYLTDSQYEAVAGSLTTEEQRGESVQVFRGIAVYRGRPGKWEHARSHSIGGVFFTYVSTNSGCGLDNFECRESLVVNDVEQARVKEAE